MSEIDNQIEEVELSIDNANEAVDLMEALLRLTKNKDYIKVIAEGYLKEEAIRLCHLRADYNFRSDEDQEGLMKAIDGIANFRQYCASLVQMGRGAQNAITADEQTREELLAEAV